MNNINDKKLSLRLIKYELRNISGNFFTIFFGLAFPILMSIIFSRTLMNDLTGELRATAMTGVYISISLILPLSILLIGYSVTYAQELENEVPLRMHLFGFRQSTMLAARLIAYFIFMTGAFLIYTLIDCLFLDIKPPTVFAAFCYILTLYLLGAIFFILSHGIAGIFKKFGPTYAVTMTLYFCFMVLCGLMGIKVGNLPKVLQIVAYTLPMTYVSKDYIDFWNGGSYNFGPIIQAFLFLGAISVIVLMYSMKRNGRIRK